MKIHVRSFTSAKTFAFDLDRPEVVTSRWFGAKGRDIVGYGTEVGHFSRRRLCALFVLDDRLFFSEGSRVFDVSAPVWRASVHRSWPFRSTFMLLEGERTATVINYFEVAETRPGDTDAHFFADVCHWLSSAESRSWFAAHISQMGR